jgi:WD40 repeat protein
LATVAAGWLLPGWMVAYMSGPTRGSLCTILLVTAAVKVWNTATGQISVVLTGHTRPVRCVGLSPDGQWAVSGSEDGILKLWNLQTQRANLSPQLHQGAILALTHSPDGKWLATTGIDGAVKLLDASSGRVVSTVSDRGPVVSSLAFSPSSDTLALGTWDGSVHFWDVNYKQPLLWNRQGGAAAGPGVGGPVRWRGYLREYRQAVESVAFSRDGQWLAVGYADGHIKIWNRDNNQEVRSWKGHGRSVTSLSFGPDRRFLASASADQLVKLWELPEAPPASLPAPPQVAAELPPEPVTPNPNEGNGEPRVEPAPPLVQGTELDQEQPLVLNTQGRGVTLLTVSTDGKQIASSDGGSLIDVWDTKSGTRLFNRKSIADREGTNLTCLVFHPKQPWLLQATQQGTLQAVDITTGAVRTAYTGHTKPIWEISFNRSGDRLVSCGADGAIILWNTETGQALWQVGHGMQSALNGVVFTPDERQIISAGIDNTVRIWEATSGGQIETRNVPQGIWALNVSPDGRWLGYQTHENGVNQVKLWDLSNKQAGPVLATLGVGQYSLVFSSDSQRLVTGGADGKVRVWEVASGRELQSLSGHTSTVKSVVFLPDGRLASGSEDGTIRIWQTRRNNLARPAVPENQPAPIPVVRPGTVRDLRWYQNYCPAGCQLRCALCTQLRWQTGRRFCCEWPGACL